VAAHLERRPAQGPGIGRLALRDLGVGASGGELLPDHAQRQELVALKAQDGAQPLHVRRGE
jgi:hypothetical protein